MWSWQDKKWPNYEWDSSKLVRAEQLFTEGAGVMAGVSRHMLADDQQALSIELISAEAMDTSEIEGEYLDRNSVRSSIKRVLGLQVDRRSLSPIEAGIAEMMVNLYRSLDTPLSETDLFEWHKMLMNGRRDLENIGAYRTHTEAMQIVSGPDYDHKVHYEAPPSKLVPREMKKFLSWFERTAPNGSEPLPVVTRAAVAHAWFETVHPFEDGNGRIGRAIAEKALAQGFATPVMTAIAKILLKKHKQYYALLNQANRNLEITEWVLWFAAVAIEAQRNTLSYIDFIIQKTKLLDRIRGQLNPRQEKVLHRMLAQGPDGFTGGLSAANYISITGATTATTTRDLRELVSKSVLISKGARKSTRYYLNIDILPVETVEIKDIL